MRARFCVAGCILLLACSGGTSSTTDPPAAPTPGVTEPVECAEGTYRTAANVCETFPSLSVTRSPATVGPVRDHHTTVIRDVGGAPYLYVFGGTDDWRILHDDVQRAKIREDGSLESFEPAGKLNAPRAGHCVARVGDRLLLAGGIVPAGGRMGPSTSSVFVRIGADGTVAEVTPGPELPKAVMHLTCEAHGEFVYAFGGRGSNSKSTTMSARARIGADGSLAAFEAQTTLNPDRSHHASFVRDNRLYLVGGITGDPAGDMEDRSDAVMAEIDAEGSIGAWTPAGKLPASVSVSSAQLYKDAVYIVGGLEGIDGFTDKIRRATFLPDGTLSEFATVAGKLPGARGHVHQTPMYKTFIYSVGGKDNAQKSLGTVDVGTFE